MSESVFGASAFAERPYSKIARRWKISEWFYSRNSRLTGGPGRLLSLVTMEHGVGYGVVGYFG